MFKKVINISLLLVLPIVFIFGSLQITTDFTDSRHVGPDEEMRYFMPKFIYDHHRLPTGYETETWGNWSYGFYPQFLGALVSTVFMSIASVFPHDNDTLIRAARLTSVLFGVIAAFFVRKTIRLIFAKHKHKDAISNMGMILFALLPQIAFLSSYVNNDIIALAGVSIILYACVHAYLYGVKLQNALYYALGASIAMLGYLNSYGFVLVGFIFLLIQLLSKKQQLNRVFIAKYLLISLGVTALITLPFFIRNAILYHGDLFGVTTFHNEYQRWLDDGGFSMQSPFGNHIASLLFGTHWVLDTFKSLTFGYFATWGRGIVSVQYWPYGIGAIIALTAAVFAYKKSPKNIQKTNLIILMAIGALITVALYFYYTVRIDYQPQGRYIIYILVPFVLCATYGIYSILQKIVRPQYQSLAIYTLCFLYTLLYASIAYQTLWA